MSQSSQCLSMVTVQLSPPVGFGLTNSQLTDGYSTIEQRAPKAKKNITAPGLNALFPLVRKFADFSTYPSSLIFSQD